MLQVLSILHTSSTKMRIRSFSAKILALIEACTRVSVGSPSVYASFGRLGNHLSFGISVQFLHPQSNRVAVYPALFLHNPRINNDNSFNMGVMDHSSLLLSFSMSRFSGEIAHFNHFGDIREKKSFLASTTERIVARMFK